ncbi:MAG: HD domain-containing protein [Campylobacter sp.]
MAFRQKNERILDENFLIPQLKKLQGKYFANFIAKQSDEVIKDYFTKTLDEIFADFLPEYENLPLCIIATEKYANNIISTSSILEILIAYKSNSGFNIKFILKQLVSKLENSNLKLNIKIYELENIFKECKNDHKAKASLSTIRYICGSKTMYKMARSEIYKTREFNKQENLKFYAKMLGAFNEIKNIKQEPDIKNDFGGTNDIYYLNCALNGFDNKIGFKTQVLKFIDEKEFSTLNLAIDFILCVKSAQNLSTNSDVFDPTKIQQITNLMQIKSKKTQETDSIISQKLFSCMHTVALFSRFLLACFYKSKFQSGFTKKELKVARLNNGFYRIENTIYTPLHKKNEPISNVLENLVNLNDINYKFDITTIFYIKRAIIEKDELELAIPKFVKILQKKNSFAIVKALLDAEVLLKIVKPLEHVNHLAEFDGYHKFTVDEHCVLSVKYLENIKDKFIKSLYDELCKEGKLMIKLVALLHDAGKGLGGEHEIVGSNIFRAYATKLNLSQKAVNIGVLLIRYHTLMNNVANRENIYDQRTIFSFISKLGDKKTLKLLYIITYCVINATDEKLYTSYLAKLLREFYEICIQSFDDENLLDEATRRVKKEQSIARHREFIPLNDSLKEKIFAIPSNLLFIKYPPADIVKVAKIADEVQNLKIDVKNQQNLNIEIFATTYPNLPALLSVLVHFDLAFMEIFELFDNKFYVKLEFNKNAKTTELQTLKDLIKTSLKSKDNVELKKPVILKGELNFDPEHCNEYAKLGINAKDQRGLMGYVLGIFKEFNVKIANARIQTIKNRTRNLLLIQKRDDVRFDEILNLLESE